MITLIYAVLFLGVLGLFAGTFLAFAAKKFEVKEDVRVLVVETALPGINCGACGYPGCSAYAKAFTKGETDSNACLPGKRSGVPEKLNKIKAMPDDTLNSLYEDLNHEISKMLEKIEKEN